jgi:hypothetical protein
MIENEKRIASVMLAVSVKVSLLRQGDRALSAVTRGAISCADQSHWPLPATDRRIDKERTEPDLDELLHYL